MAIKRKSGERQRGRTRKEDLKTKRGPQLCKAIWNKQGKAEFQANRKRGDFDITAT